MIFIFSHLYTKMFVYHKCLEFCFPSTAKVKLENDKSIMMSELQIGDRVQTGTSENFSKDIFILE